MYKNRLYFVAFCVLSIAVFIAYQSLYGSKSSQAYASLSAEGAGQTLLNYKPARKRILRSRLRRDADAMLDLTGHDIAQIFDAPELVRRDVPTTIWQYRNDACVLDVYFTVGESGEVSRSDVVHYEIRERDSRSTKALDISSCISNLLSNDTMISLIDVNAALKAK